MTDTALPRGGRPHPDYRRQGDDGRVALGVSGAVCLPRAGYDAIGRPRRVRVTPDPDGTVTFCPTTAHGPDTRRVRHPRVVCLQGLVFQLGWQAAVGRRHPYRLVGGALVVTLDLTP